MTSREKCLPRHRHYKHEMIQVAITFANSLVADDAPGIMAIIRIRKRWADHIRADSIRIDGDALTDYL